jgi:hypothetical protein
MMRSFVLALGMLLPCSALAQMAGMDMKKSAPSTELTVIELHGKTTVYTPQQFKALPHITVKVHNSHSDKDETYGGVPVKTLISTEALSGPQQPSRNVQVVVAGATDNFHVVITLCDTDPECRNGQAIVADTLDGSPLAADGAFRLVLTEDKKPARWARNLSSLTVKAVN